MPQLYYSPRAQRIPSGAFRVLPTRTLKPRLEATDVQKIIPFLGAGASLRAVPTPGLSPPQHRASTEALQTIFTECSITDPQAQRFVDVAVQVAQLIQQRNALVEQEDPELAPSSWQLARGLADMISLEPLRPVSETLQRLLAEKPAQNDYLELVETLARVLGLSHNVPQLLTVASYFNDGPLRRELVHTLISRFAQVKGVTAIQKAIGNTAKAFVEAQNRAPRGVSRNDYLVITTNYDQLMELHLMDRGVPTCVVRVDKKSNVLIDFMPGTQDFLKLTDAQFAELQQEYRQDEVHAGRRTARNFNLCNKQHALAMVYKIHGCPVSDDRYQADNVVISDQDYVTFIQRNGARNEIIPAYVQSRAMKAGFLFLGYSFADWNVRSLYQQFIKSRQIVSEKGDPGPDDGAGPDATEDVDYIVIRSYDNCDEYFFRRWRDISVIVADLDELAAALGEPTPVGALAG